LRFFVNDMFTLKYSKGNSGQQAQYLLSTSVVIIICINGFFHLRLTSVYSSH